MGFFFFLRVFPISFFGSFGFDPQNSRKVGIPDTAIAKGDTGRRNGKGGRNKKRKVKDKKEKWKKTKQKNEK